MSRPQRCRERERLRRLDLIAAACLMPLVTIAIVRCATTPPVDSRTAGAGPAAAVETRLDPNAAPWWELTHLVGIGETRAKAIVDHRRESRSQVDDPRATVFRRAADLEAVHGIGPKTVARIAPHMHFPPD